MSIAVVEKAFLVLETLAESEEPVALARLAERTLLPKPTAYRILQTLAELGYVVRDEAARYYITAKPATLSQNSRHRDLKLRVLPHMQRLHAQFNETVNLGILDGRSVRYIHVIETHTFVDGVTSVDDCRIRAGDFMLEDDGSPMSAAIDSGRQAGWLVMPAMDIRAMPGPIVEDRVVERFWDSVNSALDLHGMPDGVLLVLHGAMVSQSVDDVEGEILFRLRQLLGPGRVPVCGVIDLHANFTESMAQHSDGLISYRENPHTDAVDSAVRATHLLDRLMRTGERTTTVWQHPPLIWPPIATDTSEEPMRSLEHMARQIEQDDQEILAVNVIAGYAFADIQETGVSFTAVTTGDPSRAATQLERLSELAMSTRDVCSVEIISVDQAMRHLEDSGNGPVVLVEPSDNIGAGLPHRPLGSVWPLLA
jgi:microcystin degradation protein MlrC/predicted transcriptional regulator